MAVHIASTPFFAPTIPVIHNVNAKTESDPEKIKQLMIQQINNPVLWVDCVQALLTAGVTTVIECGPGKVLCGLCTRIEKSLNTYSLEDLSGIEKALAEI